MNTIFLPSTSHSSVGFRLSDLPTFEGLPILPEGVSASSLGTSQTIQAIAGIISASGTSSNFADSLADHLVPLPSPPLSPEDLQLHLSLPPGDPPSMQSGTDDQAPINTKVLRAAILSPPPAAYAFSVDTTTVVRTYPPAIASPTFSLMDQPIPLHALALFISEGATPAPAEPKSSSESSDDVTMPSDTSSPSAIAESTSRGSMIGIAPSPTIPTAPFPSPVFAYPTNATPTGLIAPQGQLDEALLVLSTSLAALDARAAALQASIAMQTMRRAELERQLLRAEADSQRARVLRKHERTAAASRSARVRSPSIGAKELGRKKSDARSKAELARRRSEARRHKVSASGKAPAPVTPVVPSPVVKQGEVPLASGMVTAANSLGSILDADTRIPGLRVINRGSGGSWMSAAADHSETLSRVLSSTLSFATIVTGSTSTTLIPAARDVPQLATLERPALGTWKGMKLVKMLGAKKKSETSFRERVRTEVE